MVATGIQKSTKGSEARIRELMGSKTKMLDEGSPKAMLSTCHEKRDRVVGNIFYHLCAAARGKRCEVFIKIEVEVRSLLPRGLKMSE